MKFEDALTIILSTGVHASAVLEAIHSGLTHVSKSADENTNAHKELESLMLLIEENISSDDESSPEVVLARNGHTNLKARLDNFETRLSHIDAEIELQKPRRELKTRQEIVPFKRVIEYDDKKLPSESGVTRAGVDGAVTIQFEEEFINDVSTGRIFNEKAIKTIDPVDEIYVQGTLVINATPIRYIRFGNKRQGVKEGRFVELEVFVKTSNIAKSTTPVSIPKGASQTDKNAMFDGAKGYVTNTVTGDNPYVQLDFGSARTDITSLKYYLYPLLTYDHVFVDVSSDGRNWKRMVRLTNHHVEATGDSVDVGMATLYGTPVSTYTDPVVNQDVGIGGRITLNNPSRTPIYWDSGLASLKRSSGYYIGGQKSLTVANVAYVVNKRPTGGNFFTANHNTWVVFSPKPAGNYKTLYGVHNVGWFRADEL